jgi:pimeloyl-ACP methyl ester carboxylesterase
MFADTDETIRKYAVRRYKLSSYLIPFLVDIPISLSRIYTGLFGVNYSPYFVAQKIKCPTLIVAGSLDVKAPVSDAAMILDNLKGEKELLILDKCTHGTIFFSYDIYRKRVLEFIEKE